MKAKFKKDFSHRSLWLPAVLFLSLLLGLVLGAIFWKELGFSPLFGIISSIPFLIVTYLKPYELTDRDILQGNGNIQVSQISRIERYEKGVRLFYVWPGGETIRKRFFALKDVDAFISTLLKINSNIVLN